MLMSTTTAIEGRPVREYLGVVTGEVIVGANIFKDMFASVRDIVGGRSGAYESSLRDARQQAFRELADEARAQELAIPTRPICGPGPRSRPTPRPSSPAPS